jgi:hypothetical protein
MIMHARLERLRTIGTQVPHDPGRTPSGFLNPSTFTHHAGVAHIHHDWFLFLVFFFFFFESFYLVMHWSDSNHKKRTIVLQTIPSSCIASHRLVPLTPLGCSQS